jgi:hypothetical protein
MERTQAERQRLIFFSSNRVMAIGRMSALEPEQV